jgi:hypothetical protein
MHTFSISARIKQVRMIVMILSLALMGCGCPKDRLAATSDKVPTAEEAVRLLEVLRFNGDDYDCGQTAQVLNTFRRLGKDRSLLVLSEYLKGESDSQKEKTVASMCALLFVPPPSGWRLPFGTFPEVHEDRTFDFPLFPMAISDGVPFMVVATYGFNGSGIFPEAGKDMIKSCSGLEMVRTDFRTSGFGKAAEDLITSKRFKLLYQDDSSPTGQIPGTWRIEVMIRKEAGLREVDQ